MPSSSTDERVVINTLTGESKQLQQVHEALANDNQSSFIHSPPPRAGYWNEERHEVQKLMQELRSRELVDVDGRGNPWYLTKKGKEIAEKQDLEAESATTQNSSV